MKSAEPVEQTYPYPSEALERLKRRRRRILAPIVIMVVALIFASSLVLFAPTSSSFRGLFMLVTFLSIAMAYIALATTRNIMERTERAWANYKLIVADDNIVRVQDDAEDFQLAFSEIEIVEDTPGVGIRLNPGNSLRSIFVPEAVHGYARLREHILRKSGASVRSRRFIWMKSLLGIVGGCIALGIVMSSLNVLWVLPLASLSISFLIWVFVLIQRNPNFSRTVRSTSWAYLILAGYCAWRIWYLLYRL